MTRDYKEAYAWFSLAASDGNHNAAHIRDEMEKMLPVETLLEAQSLSREYAEKYKKAYRFFY